ncbi:MULTISPECIES: MarR family winged helix-turn-helix transcriptional regulator [Paenibacillus]|uniref:MarR family transcriptional regulator n=1 Tax=Paenibacillus azoreducens TaxID=116718 RepID=A0A919YJ41_9BACL|nr:MULTISPECIES: MarR family transcriptional regulator [Paenibacillus]MBE9913267.1 MarR family transcriptional regulator [Paenibacillus donghaensis]GIO50313.1 MarR family transcriptional regulator [Paenibacillus azoreducens]
MNSKEIIPQLQLENQLCFAVYACSREITKFYQPYLDKLGVTYSQYLVLMVLWEQGQCTVKELGEALFLDSGTLTPLLKRLQAAGLINRERSTEDERKVIITLTEEGVKLRDRATIVPEAMANEICMSGGEFNRLLAEFKKLLDRVHEVNMQRDGKSG